MVCAGDFDLLLHSFHLNMSVADSSGSQPANKALSPDIFNLIELCKTYKTYVSYTKNASS